MMDKFEEIKKMVPTKKAAEYYGLAIKRNNMACCPFHDDKTASMKIDDTHYHCFGCGAHGDTVGYVASLFNLTQMEAAGKINDDFLLGIDMIRHLTEDEKKEIKRRQSEKAWEKRYQEVLKHFRRQMILKLKECEANIIASQQRVRERKYFEFSEEYACLIHSIPLVDYWLDLLCSGTEEDIEQMLLDNYNQAIETVNNVNRSAYILCGRHKRIAT